jgi:hypothetical protein
MRWPFSKVQLLHARVSEYFICSPTNKIAVIQDTAGGNLSITPAI